MDVDDFIVTLNRMKDMQRKRDLRAFRDDLIRLVVGMQWREMGHIFNVVRDQDLIDEDGGVVEPVPPEAAPQVYSHFQPASTIVDEWLGEQE